MIEDLKSDIIRADSQRVYVENLYARTEARIEELGVSLIQTQARERNAISERDEARVELLRIRPSPSHPNGQAALNLRIAELELDLARLREKGKLAVEQRRQAESERDKWEARANLAERKLSAAESASSQSGSGKSYAQIKRFLAKEFHPDHSPGSAVEKAVRTEIFKVVWAKIEEIDKAPR